jgi:hypothetical protein
MSHHETATPSPRIAITPATSAAPPWSGVKFTCSQCKAEFQLEAADNCKLRLVVDDSLRSYDTPPCPAPGCGHINIIELLSNEPIQEANAS